MGILDPPVQRNSVGHTLDVFGHSIAFGFSQAAPHTNSWPAKLASLLGVKRFRNYSWPGAVAAIDDGQFGGGFSTIARASRLPDAGWGSPLGQFLPEREIVVAHFGGNDFQHLQGRSMASGFAEGTRSILSRLRACVGRVYSNTDSAWTFTGAWGAFDNPMHGSNGHFRSTYDPAATARFTVPADHDGAHVVTVCVVITADVVIGVKVNGASRSNWSVVSDANAGSDSIVPTRTTPAVLRLSGLAAGDAVTLNRVSGSDALYVDSAWIESAAVDGPVIVAPLLNYVSGSSRPTGPINDANTDTFKAVQRAICAEFPNVLAVDFDPGLNKAAINFATDTLHFSDVGASVAARAAYKALTDAGLPTSRQTTSALVDPEPPWMAFSGTGSAPAIRNSWISYGSPWSPAGFTVDGGMVRLRGAILGGVVDGSLPFAQLPYGFLPSDAGQVFFPVVIAGSKIGTLWVNPINGYLTITGGSVNDIVYLDGVSWKAAR